MRTIFVAIVAVAAVGFVGLQSAKAGTAPWCAVIATGNGNDHWDCQYGSIEECRPNVLAGNRGWCNPNPSSSRTQPRQIDITASVTLIRNRRDTSTTLWASSNALPPPRRESCVKAPGGRRFQFRLAHACLPRRLGSPGFGRCPLLAQSGHGLLHCECPLLGVKRTLPVRRGMSANDPKRTL